MTSPLVSVILPTYNRPVKLQEAVSTVDKQSYDNIEIIVVDDCSETPAKSAIEFSNISTNVNIIRHRTNRGANAARNTGIEASSGKYVSFLDDDDLWDKRKIEHQVQCIQNQCGDVVYTGVQQFDNKNNLNGSSCPSIEGNVSESLLSGNFIGSFSNILVTSDAVDQVGGLDEQYPCWQDWDFYLRLSENVKFLSVDQPLVRRRHHKEQISSDYKIKRDIAAPRIWEKFNRLASTLNKKPQFKSAILFELGLSALTNERYSDARRDMSHAVYWQPYNFSYYPFLLASVGGQYTYKPMRFMKRRLTRWTNIL